MYRWWYSAKPTAKPIATPVKDPKTHIADARLEATKLAKEVIEAIRLNTHVKYSNFHALEVAVLIAERAAAMIKPTDTAESEYRYCLAVQKVLEILEPIQIQPIRENYEEYFLSRYGVKLNGDTLKTINDQIAAACDAYVSAVKLSDGIF